MRPRFGISCNTMPEREGGQQDPALLESVEMSEYGPPTAEQALAERLALADERLGAFFDRAKLEQQIPARQFIDELNIPRLERIFPSQHIQQVIESITALPDEIDRETFIARVRTAVEPFIRAETLDPVVRQKVEAMNEEQKMKFTDPDTGHALLCTLRELGQDIELADAHHVQPRDKVLEVSWSEGLEGPKGFKSIQRIFREIARYVADHPDVQAVTGVSWMMAHPIARRFGFEVRPDVEFPVNQKIGSADLGNAARQGKPEMRQITSEEVLFGIMSREAFLERFST